MSEIAKVIISQLNAPPKFPTFVSSINHSIKRLFRQSFGSFYFKFRYLNALNVNLKGQVYKNSFDHYTKNISPLYFSESKMQELFELADKAKFLSASLIQIDIQEVSSIDNYKEGYTYTAPYAKFLKMLHYKELYLANDEPEYFKAEIEKCFDKLEEYVKVYEAIFLLSSYSEELKLYMGRLANLKQKESLLNILTKVIKCLIQNYSDTPECMKQELDKLLENYKIIKSALNDYPLWKLKFEEDVNKQLANINIRFHNDKIFDVIDQQKSFK